MTANDQTIKSSTAQRAARQPRYSAEDKTLMARNLRILLPIVMLLLILEVVVNVMQNSGSIHPAQQVILLLVFMVGALWVLAWRGHTLIAAALLPLVTFLGMAYLAWDADQIFDGAFAALIVSVIMAGLLLGWKAAAFMALLCVAATWWLVSLSAGAAVTLSESAAPEYAIQVTVVYALVVVLLYLLIRDLRQAVIRSRANEQLLREQNAELTAMHTTLEQQVADRTNQLRTAAEVSQAAASILEPHEMLGQVVNLIAVRFGFYYAAVFTLDRSNAYLVLREATGEAGRILKERGHRLRVGSDAVVSQAALKRTPCVAQESELEATHSLLPETRSEIALPLLAGDQVLGVLDVQAAQPHAFDDSSLATLQNVAAQTAIALQNAQSYQQLQEALGYTTRQYELSRTIFTAQSPTEAYQALGQVFAMVSDIDRISVYQISERDMAGQPTEYELAIEWDILGGAQFNKGMRYSLDETPLAHLVTEEDATVIRDAQDTRLPLDTRQQLERAHARAAMLVPLLIRGRLQGFIAAVSEQPHDFQESEVRLMKSAAEQLGVVLSNLQLATEMQTTLERVALLNRRLSGETWNSYLTGREQWLVESGQVQQALKSTCLQVPIVIRGETIGLFNVADAEADRHWQEEELTMLGTIAGEVALAIENARLIEQTQRTAQREKDIANAADKIHRSINLEAILHTAVEEVMRIAGTTEVAIQLGRPEIQPDQD